MAAENIAKDQIVYTHDERFIKVFTREEFNALPELQQALISKHATHYSDGTFWYDTDDTRFINHSSNPNIEFFGDGDSQAKALRDIKEGEEVTLDYIKLSPLNTVDDYPKDDEF